MSRFRDRAEAALVPQYKEFGDAARYTPPGGGVTVDCTIIRDREDAETGFKAAVTQSNMVEVRQSELPAPKRDGTFAMLDSFGSPTGETLIIISDPKTPEDDADRLLWLMTVR
jgi:hypothetical protein